MVPCDMLSSIDCQQHNFISFITNFYNAHVWECHIFLATLVGSVIGFERELRGKAAGIRTYALVAMGACLFATLSGAVGGTHDAARIAAQIVSGIGFLGAGVIWHKDGGIVEGLTTAAALWGVAAIGMSIGFGFISLALTSAVTVLIIMELFGLAVILIKKIFKLHGRHDGKR